MADSDANPERSPGDPQPSMPRTAGPSGLTSPDPETPADDPRSQGLVLESTRGYTAPAPAKDWHIDLRLEDLKLDPPKNRDSIGRLEHYEILGYVGRGAMGVVLKAFDEQLHRQVAIKVMSPELISRPTARERFFREARAAAGINHPNVVTIHAVSEHRGLPYLVMEFVGGMTLAERIHRQAPLPTHDILRLCVQIADGLSAAHRQGIIHRDVKPANIMLEDGLERVKITDFGLARVAMENSDLTSFGDMVGTPAFMSPEQVDGQTLDARSDLFSLGCVIYAMVAGKSPFRSGNALATARKVITDPHLSLREVSPNVPKYLVEITDRLLQKLPADRYESAEVLHQELTRRLAEEHLTADDSSMLLRMSRVLSPASAVKGRRAWLAVLVLLLVVVAGVQSVQFWKDRHRVSPEITTPSSVATNVPTVATPQVVTVAADGSADFRRVTDALRRVSPGGTVRVVDAARYDSAVRIDSAELFSNVTLEATAGATLFMAPKNGTAVLTIQETPGVKIRGFQLETSGHQRAVEVVGSCPGLLIEDCVLRTVTPPETTIGSVYLHAAAAGTKSAPIQLRNLRIEAGAVGIVVGGGMEESDPVSQIVIAECQIRGATRDYGIPIVFQTAASDVRVTRNRLSTGTIGINLAFSESQRATNVEITDNTFHNLGYFLGLPDALDQSVRLDSNLVVESNGPLSDGALASHTKLAEVRGWFHENWWERLPGVDEVPLREVMRMVTYVPLRSREWGSPEFLAPAKDAPPDLPGRFREQEPFRSSGVPSVGKQE